MKTCDKDIREELHNSYFYKYEDDLETLIVDELGVCQGDARIDIAVINGSLHGYEIKSDRDTLARLPNQIEYYNKVFDRLTIVAGLAHIKKVTETIPSWWGIISVEAVNNDEIKLSSIRKPKQNKYVEAYSLSQLLWKSEALDILKELNLHKGYMSKPKYILWERLAENIEIHILKEYVRKKLKARVNWRVDL